MSRKLPTLATLNSPAQAARAMRWELVHAAGCTEPNCAAKFWVHGDSVASYLDGYTGPPVSVPRSLRRLFGVSIIRPEAGGRS